VDHAQWASTNLLEPITLGDQGTASKDLVQVPIGPVTRARAKKFKDVLNGLIEEERGWWLRTWAFVTCPVAWRDSISKR
jgi:hypothetical protein